MVGPLVVITPLKVTEFELPHAVNVTTASAVTFVTEAIGGWTSARVTNEENYLMQKLMRAVIGTNHVDHCARL